MRPIVVLPLICISACGSPAETARRELDRTARVVMTTEAAYKRLTRTMLKVIATEQAARRTADLATAKCSTAASQPTATPVCLEIVSRHQKIYDARCAQVTDAARRIDAAVRTVYTAMLLALDAVEELEAGIGKEGSVKELVVKLVALVADVKIAYEEFKLNADAIAGVKP